LSKITVRAAVAIAVAANGIQIDILRDFRNRRAKRAR
jgi:hypothetical protein